jgi:palmitoyltransferase ZDHHC3/7/25
MIVAQRRGKVAEKATTVLVTHNDGNPVEHENNNNAGLFVPPGSSGASIRVATVRRNWCGTGPFDLHWLNLDCCGIICALFTYALHVYAVYAVSIVLLPPWMSYTNNAESGVGTRTSSLAGHFHRFAFTAIAVLAVISHFKAMTTDPGAVPPDAKPLEEELEKINDTLDESTGSALSAADRERNFLLNPPERSHVKRLCRRCKSFKPQRAHHCSVCRRCIIKMDHHCPWVNNCVGIGNHKYFLLFVFYTFISCCYSLTLVVTRFSTCGGGNGYIGSRAYRRSHGLHAQREALEAAAAAGNHHHDTCLDRPSHLLTILGLVIEAILFGMFTSCMMFDQAEVVRSKLTHIDRFKGADVGGGVSGVVEVFGVGRQGLGSSFRTDWLSPFVRVCFPSSVTDEVMGFCRPCKPEGKDTNGSSPQGSIKGTRSNPNMVEIL